MNARRIEPEEVALDGRPLGDASDLALLSAIGGGDGMALAALYDRYGSLALAVAYRVLGERGASEDAVQEAFLAVWRHAAQYRAERGPVRAWLLTIARNAAIDRRRGRAKRDEAALPLDDLAFGLAGDSDDPFAVASSRLEADGLRAAMAELPGEQREAIELAFFGGLTHQEVAMRTGQPLGTIKGRMRLGLEKLRVTLLSSSVAMAESSARAGLRASGPPPEGVGR